VSRPFGRLLVVGVPPMIAQGFVRLLQQAGVSAAYAALPLSPAGSRVGDEVVGILALVGHNESSASSLLMQVRESLPNVTLYLLGAARMPWLEAVSTQVEAINLSESSTSVETIVSLLARTITPDSQGPTMADRLGVLTQRERQLLEALASYLGTDEEFARAQGISPHTLRAHLQNIRRKLGATNRAEAIEVARSSLPPAISRGPAWAYSSPEVSEPVRRRVVVCSDTRVLAEVLVAELATVVRYRLDEEPCRTLESLGSYLEEEGSDVVLLGDPVTANMAMDISQLSTRFPRTRFVVLQLVEPRAFPDVYRAGVTGFLGPNVTIEEFTEALDAVAAGELFISSDETRRIIDDLTLTRQEEDEVIKRFLTLSEREKDVYVKLAEGRKESDIGSLLFISNATVRTHIQHLLTKMGVHSRMQAIQLEQTYRLLARFHSPLDRSPGTR
jgi:two-component system nitrate/nitrite response regulator NarL